MRGSYSSDGTALAFSESGAGLPVIFLHPTPLDHDYWRQLVTELAGVRAIIPDLRGHGQSNLGTNLPVGLFTRVPDAPVLTIAQLASDVVTLLDHLELPNAAFAGCSIGGYVLLELWRRIPDRMRGLAFVCSKPQPDAEANLVKRAENIGKVRAGETAQLLDGMAQTLVGATARARQPQIVDQVRARMMISAEAVVAVQAGLATRPDSISTVGSITAPVLAIAGGEDGAVTATEVEAFKASPGGCDYHLIADAGHFAAYEQPQRVASLFLPWLRRFEL